MDNLKQVIRDIKYQIDWNLPDEMLEERINKFIRDRDMYKLADFQFWQLEKGYLDRSKVKNGMVQEYLNEKN